MVQKTHTDNFFQTHLSSNFGVKTAYIKAKTEDLEVKGTLHFNINLGSKVSLDPPQ